MTIKGTIILCLVFLASCNGDKTTQVTKENGNPIAMIPLNDSLLLNKAINEGDFTAYNKISAKYILQSATTDFFFYSFIMANKYNCPEAYYHVYYFLNIKGSVNNINLYSDDKKTKKISLFYLCKSYELGYEPAKIELISLFGEKKKIPLSNSILSF